MEGASMMIETQPFGKTGHESTRIIFGAAALASVSQDDADRTLEVLQRHGINHIDVAASYGDAELRVGPWMEQRAADFETLMATCAERGIAVQTIKSIARRPWGDQERSYTTWYEPLTDQADIDHAVHWVLNRPGVFLNTVSDIGLLAKVLDAAERFQAAPSAAPLGEELEKLELEPLFV
jgi:predicted aldo/keto reductase-like oxidoreductase